MLLEGYTPGASGKRPMMLLAVLAGWASTLGLVTLSSQTALIALQLLNAIFIGIVAGIGMSHFQDLMLAAPGGKPPCSPTASAPAPSWREPLPAPWRRSGVSTGLWWLPHWRWLHWPPAGGAQRQGPIRPEEGGRAYGCVVALVLLVAGSAAAARPAGPRASTEGGEQVGRDSAAAAGQIEPHPGHRRRALPCTRWRGTQA